MLISVVGADGAGKSTLTRLLARRLTELGRPIERIDRWDIVDNPAYPATRFMRPDVPDTRLCVAEMPTESRFLFLMWSISMAVLGKRNPSGSATLLDGYWMKHAASEIVYGLDRPWVEAITAGLPSSDVVLYLRVDPEAAWERKRDGDVVPYECGMDPNCGEHTFLSHQRKIRAELDSWAERDGWIVVDPHRPVPEVLDDLVRRAESALDEHSVSAG
ncbi:dTMP kinase [Saccharopolyspora phatthalungensis]|uniref:Thymidylate kinase n=1 Tax=Saccharopolyspora phatthalungensis TaxID=664693 RepID=A0A840QH79_9PSEU|nr:thymidylate kinase [Saccharopolyspora phatthalungensis]MBB5159491.1 thymidylate kinase [Saccharopolyspora phatthalungensis]